MFGDVNKVILVGGVVRNEVRYTSSGKAILSLSIACARRFLKDNEWVSETEYMQVTSFQKNSENLNNYLKKGTKLYIEGSLRTDKWEDKDGNKKSQTKVVAEKIMLLHNFLTKEEAGIGSKSDAKEAFEEFETTPDGSDKGYDDMPF